MARTFSLDQREAVGGKKPCAKPNREGKGKKIERKWGGRHPATSRLVKKKIIVNISKTFSSLWG